MGAVGFSNFCFFKSKDKLFLKGLKSLKTSTENTYRKRENTYRKSPIRSTHFGSFFLFKS
jgi:hypothetical protein